MGQRDTFIEVESKKQCNAQQTLEQHQRRKDIYQALTSNMAEIFAFFMRLIELHVQEFREKTAAGDYTAASNERVVQVIHTLFLKCNMVKLIFTKMI